MGAHTLHDHYNLNTIIATNHATATMQVFKADAATVKLLTVAGSNIWWIELVSGKSFSYNLQPLGTDRLYSIRFDLTTEVETATAPCGWKDE